MPTEADIATLQVHLTELAKQKQAEETQANNLRVFLDRYGRENNPNQVEQYNRHLVNAERYGSDIEYTRSQLTQYRSQIDTRAQQEAYGKSQLDTGALHTLNPQEASDKAVEYAQTPEAQRQEFASNFVQSRSGAQFVYPDSKSVYQTRDIVVGSNEWSYGFQNQSRYETQSLDPRFFPTPNNNFMGYVAPTKTLIKTTTDYPERQFFVSDSKYRVTKTPEVGAPTRSDIGLTYNFNNQGGPVLSHREVQATSNAPQEFRALEQQGLSFAVSSTLPILALSSQAASSLNQFGEPGREAGNLLLFGGSMAASYSLGLVGTGKALVSNPVEATVKGIEGFPSFIYENTIALGGIGRGQYVQAGEAAGNFLAADTGGKLIAKGVSPFVPTKIGFGEVTLEKEPVFFGAYIEKGTRATPVFGLHETGLKLGMFDLSLDVVSKFKNNIELVEPNTAIQGAFTKQLGKQVGINKEVLRQSSGVETFRQTQGIEFQSNAKSFDVKVASLDIYPETQAGILELINKESHIEVFEKPKVELYGSSLQKSLLGEKMERRPNDYDIHAANPIEFIQKAEDVFKQTKTPYYRKGNIISLVRTPELIKQFGEAKEGLKELHVIDVHQMQVEGETYGETGKTESLGYGFQPQPRIKIGEVQAMALGEQGVRKGISTITLRPKEGVVNPVPHRMKDIGDFVIVQEALIEKGKKSFNPVEQVRARYAEVQLNLFKSTRPEPVTETPSKTLLYRSSSSDVLKPEYSSYPVSIKSNEGYYKTPGQPSKAYYPEVQFKPNDYGYPSSKQQSRNNYPVSKTPNSEYPKTKAYEALNINAYSIPSPPVKQNYSPGKPPYPGYKIPSSNPPGYPSFNRTGGPSTPSYNPPNPPIKPNVIPPIPTPEKPIFSGVTDETKTSNKRKRFARGFNVDIRRRGKFKQVATNLDFGEGINRGVNAVRSGLAATFRLRPGGFIETNDNGYNQPNKREFYQPRNTQNTFIQRRGFRLSSFGERSEIQSAKRKKFMGMF